MSKERSFSKSRGVNSLSERNYLKNPDDLCAFYKNKASRLENKFNELWTLLDNLNTSFKGSNKLLSELQARTAEVTQYQLAESNLQVFLFREREENLRLAAENDALRIRNYENNRAIDILLKLCGINRDGLVELLSGENGQEHGGSRGENGKQCVTSRSSRSTIGSRSGRADDDWTTRDALLLQVKSLKTQLENLRTLFRDEVDVLLKDREVIAEQWSAESTRLNQQLTLLSTNLSKTQENLQETLSRLLLVQEEKELDSEAWIKEKNSLKKQFLSVVYNRDDHSALTLSGVGSSRVRPCNVKLLQTRIEEQEKLAFAYRQQCKNLEMEVKKWKDRAESAEKLFKEKSQSLAADLALMRNRCEELDRRRLVETEGFRTDIRLLRDRLRELDKKILKMKSEEISAAKLPPEEDLNTSTRHTLQRAKQFEKEVVALKHKFASLAF